jgi:hypothetical protein
MDRRRRSLSPSSVGRNERLLASLSHTPPEIADARKLSDGAAVALNSTRGVRRDPPKRHSRVDSQFRVKPLVGAIEPRATRWRVFDRARSSRVNRAGGRIPWILEPTGDNRQILRARSAHRAAAAHACNTRDGLTTPYPGEVQHGCQYE